MQVLTEESNLVNIANSIRNKTGVGRQYAPAEMAGAIAAIETGAGLGAAAGIDCGIKYYSDFNNIRDGGKNNNYIYTRIEPVTGNIENMQIQAAEMQQERDINTGLLDLTYNMDIFKRYDESKVTLIYDNGIKMKLDDGIYTVSPEIHCKLKIREEDLPYAKVFYSGVPRNGYWRPDISFIVYYTDGTSEEGIDYLDLKKPVDYIDFIMGSPNDWLGPDGTATFYPTIASDRDTADYIYGSIYGRGIVSPSIYCPSDIIQLVTEPIEIINAQSGIVSYLSNKNYSYYKIIEADKTKATFFPDGIPSYSISDEYLNGEISFKGYENNYYLFISSLSLDYFNITFSNASQILKSDKYNAFLIKTQGTNDVKIKLDFVNTYLSLERKVMDNCLIRYKDEINQKDLNKKIEELFSIGFDNYTNISMNIDLPSEFYAFKDADNNLIADFIDIDNNLIKRKYAKYELTAENISNASYTTSSEYVYLYFYSLFPSDKPIDGNNTSYVYSNIGYPAINYKEFNVGNYSGKPDKCYIVKSGSYIYITNPLWKRKNEQGYDITSQVVARAKEELLNAPFTIEFYYPLNSYYIDNIKEEYNPIKLEIPAYTPSTIIKNKYIEQYIEYKYEYKENIITGKYRSSFEIKKATNEEYGIMKPDNNSIYINNDNEVSIKELNIGESFNLKYDEPDKLEIENGSLSIPIAIDEIKAKESLIDRSDFIGGNTVSLSITNKLFNEIYTTIPEISCITPSTSSSEKRMRQDYIIHSIEDETYEVVKHTYKVSGSYNTIYPDGTAVWKPYFPDYLIKGFNGSFINDISCCNYGWGKSFEFFKDGETINEYANVEIGALVSGNGTYESYFTKLIDKTPFVFDGSHCLFLNNTGFKYNTFDSLRFKDFTTKLTYGSSHCEILIDNPNLYCIGVNTPLQDKSLDKRELINGVLFFADEDVDFDNVTLTIKFTRSGNLLEENILFTKNSDIFHKIQKTQGNIHDGHYREYWFMYFNITDYLKSKGYENVELLFDTYNIYSFTMQDYINYAENKRENTIQQSIRYLFYDLFMSHRCLLRGYTVSYSDPDYSKYYNNYYNPFYNNIYNTTIYLLTKEIKTKQNISNFYFSDYYNSLHIDTSINGPESITGYYYYKGDMIDYIYNLNTNNKYIAQNDKYGFVKSDGSTLDIKNGIVTITDIKLNEDINSEDNLRYEGTKEEKVKNLEIVGKHEFNSPTYASSLLKNIPKYVKKGTKIKLYNRNKSKVSSCNIPFDLFNGNIIKPETKTFERTMGVNTMLSTDDLVFEGNGLISKPYTEPIKYINGFCSAAPLISSVSQLMSYSYGAAIENGRLYIKTAATESSTLEYPDVKFTNDIVFSRNNQKIIIRPKTENVYLLNVRTDFSSTKKFDTILFYNYSRLSSFDIDFIYMNNEEITTTITKTFSSSESNNNFKLSYDYDSSARKYIYYKGLALDTIEDELSTPFWLYRSDEVNPIYIEMVNSYWSSYSTAQNIANYVASNFASNYVYYIGGYDIKGLPVSEEYINAQRERIAAVEPIIFIGDLVTKESIELNETTYPDLFNLTTQEDCTIIDFELPDSDSLTPTFKGVSTMPSNVNKKFDSIEQRVAALEEIIYNLQKTISDLKN